ncbi:MAG TPA: alpha/beta fold hydrolase [Nocardioides sp.]|nr:alpha/beta fold hydrolase [Nocardioides sp.]
MTQGPAPIVLVAPAMAIGSRYYRPLVAAFEERGWSARALPRRGFEADGVRASRDTDWSYDDEIADIARAVRDARAEQPDRPVVVLGHSLGGQLAVGNQLHHEPADALVTIGTSLPHHRVYPRKGPHIVVMAGLLVPVLTAAFGYLPKPAFGAPGARTLMREWARMALTGRPPYDISVPVTAPSLVISLEDDAIAPTGAIDSFARRLFAPQAVERWTCRHADLPEDGSNDHIQWVRAPAPVVDHVVAWWHARDRASA